MMILNVSQKSSNNVVFAESDLFGTFRTSPMSRFEWKYTGLYLRSSSASCNDLQYCQFHILMNVLTLEQLKYNNSVNQEANIELCRMTAY